MKIDIYPNRGAARIAVIAALLIAAEYHTSAGLWVNVDFEFPSTNNAEDKTVAGFHMAVLTTSRSRKPSRIPPERVRIPQTRNGTDPDDSSDDGQFTLREGSPAIEEGEVKRGNRKDTITFDWDRRFNSVTLPDSRMLHFGAYFAGDVIKGELRQAQWERDGGEAVEFDLPTSSFCFYDGNSFHFSYTNDEPEPVELRRMIFQAHTAPLLLADLLQSVSLSGEPLLPTQVQGGLAAGECYLLSPGETIDFEFPGEFPPFMTVQGLSISPDGTRSGFALQWSPPPSTFEIIDVQLDPVSRNVAITWNSAADKSYQVEVSNSLRNWITLEGGIQSGGEETTHTHTIPEGIARRYYRVIVDD